MDDDRSENEDISKSVEESNTGDQESEEINVGELVKESRLIDYKDLDGNPYVVLSVFAEEELISELHHEPSKTMSSIYDYLQGEYNLNQYPDEADSDGSRPFISFISIYNSVGVPQARYWFERSDSDLYSEQLCFLDTDDTVMYTIDMIVR